MAMLSLLGQRARPSGMRRLLGLKVVASRPERLARPEADIPYSAARVSSARQISSCFIDNRSHRAVFVVIVRFGETYLGINTDGN